MSQYFTFISINCESMRENDVQLGISMMGVLYLLYTKMYKNVSKTKLIIHVKRSLVGRNI